MDLLPDPDLPSHSVEVLSHARGAPVAEIKDLAEERRQVRNERVPSALLKLPRHVVGPEFVRAASVARMRIVEDISPVRLQQILHFRAQAAFHALNELRIALVAERIR